ncbi:DUF6602 domain-containing protein [Streptomyces roseus]|uniref:DUF6602 domain-containing protein n=1 Tax=Streptomyces roseus TaxID=66430 RepID=UPI00368384F7
MEGHELQRFIDQMAVELADEYERIRLRATEDPGTAGDEGEENWANLIREIVPASYPVVTKGRILSADGRATPQIDVLVLSPAYPPFLVRKAKKVYLAEAVVAAFECKLTLKTNHVLEAARTAALVRTMTDIRSGDPEAELFGTPFYGVLAHSHSWKGEGSTPMKNVRAALSTALDSAQHPRDLLNLVCVADLATWTLMTAPWVGPPVREEPQVLTSIRTCSRTGAEPGWGKRVTVWLRRLPRTLPGWPTTLSQASDLRTHHPEAPLGGPARCVAAGSGSARGGVFAPPC